MDYLTEVHLIVLESLSDQTLSLDGEVTAMAM